jgi:hypothetical protein
VVPAAQAAAIEAARLLREVPVKVEFGAYPVRQRSTGLRDRCRVRLQRDEEVRLQQLFIRPAAAGASSVVQAGSCSVDLLRANSDGVPTVMSGAGSWFQRGISDLHVRRTPGRCEGVCSRRVERGTPRSSRLRE